MTPQEWQEMTYECDITHHFACACREATFERYRVALAKIREAVQEIGEGGTLDWAQISYLRNTLQGVLE